MTGEVAPSALVSWQSGGELGALLSDSPCPFARDSLWAAVICDAEAPAVVNNIRSDSDRLRAAHKLAATGTADGILLRFPNLDVDEDLEHERMARKVLGAIAEVLSGPSEIRREDLYDPGWRFALGDHPYFVLSLSGHSPPTEARFMSGLRGLCFFLQHPHAFTSRFPAGITAVTRSTVRKRFASAGRRYTGDSGVLTVPGALDDEQ
jgi:hypothetical protein